MRLSNLKKHLQRKRRSPRSASGSSVDRSGWQIKLGWPTNISIYLLLSTMLSLKKRAKSWSVFLNCFFCGRFGGHEMFLAIHFDYSSIYREHRNNFDQKLQNKSEKLIKTFVSTSHLSDEFVWVASYVCRKLFSSGFYRENLAFFPPEIYFWIPVPSSQSQNELFFSAFDWSNWFQLRASIDRPLKPSWICRKTSLFFSLVTEIRAIVTCTHVHIWKSRAQKRYIMNKW